MNNKIDPIIALNNRTEILGVTIGGAYRLLAILAALVFWQTLACFLVVLISLGVLSVESLHQYSDSVLLVLSIFGGSPVLLTVLSWRFSEKIINKYIDWYKDKHIEYE